MKKRTKVILGVIAALLLLIVCSGGLLYLGIMKGTGPFKNIAAQISENHIRNHAGNTDEYLPENAEANPDSPLQGMNICFLGSSVTLGTGGLNHSFVEVLAQQNGFEFCKEAISGTTLVDTDDTSYVSRLKKLDANAQFDLFVCQLSTNDAANGSPLGSVSGGTNLDDFDTQTVAGAIEYIIGYAQETWNCPVVFYTGSHYDKPEYGQMVELLLEIQKKWDIGVIDMWHDSDFNNITEEERSLYMIDGVHPTMAGYLLWWGPYMETYLCDYVGK